MKNEAPNFPKCVTVDETHHFNKLTDSVIFCSACGGSVKIVDSLAGE